MNLLTISWESVGKNGKADLKDVMETKDLTPFDVAAEATKDYIDTWDMENGNWGKTYYYVDAPEIDPSYADTWCNDSLEPVETTAIQAGAGFWYRAYGEGTTLTFTSPVK